jgi:hypothetical protein
MDHIPGRAGFVLPFKSDLQYQAILSLPRFFTARSKSLKATWLAVCHHLESEKVKLA